MKGNIKNFLLPAALMPQVYSAFPGYYFYGFHWQNFDVGSFFLNDWLNLNYQIIYLFRYHWSEEGEREIHPPLANFFFSNMKQDCINV